MQEVSLTIEDVLPFVGLLFDVVSVGVIVIGFVVATSDLLINRWHPDNTRQYRVAIGPAIKLIKNQ